MSHVVRFEIPDEWAIELKDKSQASGLDEAEQAKRIFMIGMVVDKSIASAEPGKVGSSGAQGTGEKRFGESSAVENSDWVRAFAASEEFRRVFVENLAKSGVIVRKGTERA